MLRQGLELKRLPMLSVMRTHASKFLVFGPILQSCQNEFDHLQPHQLYLTGDLCISEPNMPPGSSNLQNI